MLSLISFIVGFVLGFSFCLVLILWYFCRSTDEMNRYPTKEEWKNGFR